ncbi:uncharacterized protein JCM10292_000096 [Rhodotorula paludigena]|uniref:uncharacterized protein n=1 Tax=Rhodotorula paludigena TaxID=86838 RepID=UPI003179540F
MSVHQATSPSGPSSSIFGHSTPALSHRIANLDASSSSPPTDVIATPSDRHDAPSRHRNGKHQPRRSVRIRTSSGGGHLDSSPHVGPTESVSFLPESDGTLVHEIPSRTRASRTSSSTPALAHAAPSRSTRATRTAAPARTLSAQASLDAFKQAQALGITPDQFEQAKQQVMRFLRTDGVQDGSAAPPPLSIPGVSPFGYVPGVSSQPYSATSPSLSSAPSPFPPNSHQQHPYPHSISRTPTTSSLQSAFDTDAARTRARPQYEVPGRSVKRQKRDSSGPSAAELAMRQWAQEESSSSSDEDESESRSLASMLVNRRPGTATRASAANHISPGLAPSPLASGSGANRSSLAVTDANASPSLAGQRGMMDRFISSQPPDAVVAPDAAVPHFDQAMEQAHPVASEQPQTTPTLQPAVVPAPASPARNKPLVSYPQHALMSPAPSKPNTSVLFSPDVARLLRSELDELEANELAGRKGSPLSPRKEVDRSSDIVVDSSPFRGNASPFSSGGASRSRDIFSSSQENTLKRTRWSNFTASLDHARPTSPTPSAGSMSMRAPSFCDSSPAASERGAGAPRHQLYLVNADVQPHPASAPDFIYGGVPSSSPTSSHHSDYVPPRFARSSPGPRAEPVRSDTSSTEASTSRSKRPTARRTESLPTPIGDPNTKPRYSYAALIGQALFSTEDHRMALADIYAWVMARYPYFKKGDAGWQNSIRHNLSLNPCFIKTVRAPDNPGKGCLWAIKPGTEDQFVDGDFIRKGGQSSTRRKGKAAQATVGTAVTRPSPQKLLRTDSAASTSSSTAAPTPALPASQQRRQSTVSLVSSRSDSPVPSVASRASHPQPPQRPVAAPSPASSTMSNRSLTPVSAASPAPQPALQLQPPVEIEFAAAPVRPASAAGLQRPHIEEQAQLAPPVPLARSHSSMGFLEPASVAAAAAAAAIAHAEKSSSAMGPIAEDVKRQVPQLAPPVNLARTASTPMLPSHAAPGKLAPPPASPPPARTLSRFHEPLLSTTMSPPTSVYHRLAGPYQPLSYGGAASQNHRALALLASPEASGIMGNRGSPRSGATLLAVSAGSPTQAGASTTFLPRRRQRTESDKVMLSPTALVHTQSPISSVRGGPRAPMSPVQDKLEPVADPEKKAGVRPTGARLLPALNALATGDIDDPFRSPPPSSTSGSALQSTKYHLRSPSARLQAALSTPGGTKGRLPLGFSPSLATGASWERSTAAAQGAGDGMTSPGWVDLYGGGVEVELEHFGRRAGTAGARLSWPSPSTGTGSGHLGW